AQAQAQEAEDRLVKNSRRHAEAGLDEHRGDAVGQHVAENDAPPGQSRRHRRVDEVEVPQLEKFGADEAGVARPDDQPDDDHHEVEAAPERDHHDQQQDQPGDGLDDLDEAHADQVEPPAIVAEQSADDDSDHRGDAG